MQVEIMRDLALFDNERGQIELKTATCGCLWFVIENLGVVPAEPLHIEILWVCGRNGSAPV